MQVQDNVKISSLGARHRQGNCFNSRLSTGVPPSESWLQDPWCWGHPAGGWGKGTRPGRSLECPKAQPEPHLGAEHKEDEGASWHSVCSGDCPPTPHSLLPAPSSVTFPKTRDDSPDNVTLKKMELIILLKSWSNRGPCRIGACGLNGPLEQKPTEVEEDFLQIAWLVMPGTTA